MGVSRVPSVGGPGEAPALLSLRAPHWAIKGENGRASEPALFEHDPCSSADSVETRFVLAPALAAPPISAFTAQPRAWGSGREAVSARSVWGVLWGDETLGDSAEVRACV